MLVRLCLKSLGCSAQHAAVLSSSQHLFVRALYACSASQVFRFKMLVRLLYHFPSWHCAGELGLLDDGASVSQTIRAMALKRTMGL